MNPHYYVQYTYNHYLHSFLVNIVVFHNILAHANQIFCLCVVCIGEKKGGGNIYIRIVVFHIDSQAEFCGNS